MLTRSQEGSHGHGGKRPWIRLIFYPSQQSIEDVDVGYLSKVYVFWDEASHACHRLDRKALLGQRRNDASMEE